MAWLGAALGIASKILGFAERADKKQERREDMQTGARIQNATELEAERAELEKDLKVYAEPSNPARAKRRLRGRLRQRLSGDD